MKKVLFTVVALMGMGSYAEAAPSLTLTVTGLPASNYIISDVSDTCNTYKIQTGTITCSPKKGGSKLYLPKMLDPSTVTIAADGVAFDKYGNLKIPYTLGKATLAFSGQTLKVTAKHSSGGAGGEASLFYYVPFKPIQVNLREDYFNSGKELKEIYPIASANMHLVGDDMKHDFISSKMKVTSYNLQCQGLTGLCQEGQVNSGHDANGLLYVVASQNSRGGKFFVRNDSAIAAKAKLSLQRAAQNDSCQKLGSELYYCPSSITLQANLKTGLQCNVLDGGSNCTRAVPTYFYWGLREKSIPELTASVERNAKANNVALFNPIVFKMKDGVLQLPKLVSDSKQGLLSWLFDLGGEAASNNGKDIQLYFHTKENFANEKDTLLQPKLDLPAVAQVIYRDGSNHVVDQTARISQNTIVLPDGTSFVLVHDNGIWSIKMTGGNKSQAALYEINVDAVNTKNQEVATTTIYLDANNGAEAALNVMRGNSFYLYY